MEETVEQALEGEKGDLWELNSKGKLRIAPKEYKEMMTQEKKSLFEQALQDGSARYGVRARLVRGDRLQAWLQQACKALALEEEGFQSFILWSSIEDLSESGIYIIYQKEVIGPYYNVWSLPDDKGQAPDSIQVKTRGVIHKIYARLWFLSFLRLRLETLIREEGEVTEVEAYQAEVDLMRLVDEESGDWDDILCCMSWVYEYLSKKYGLFYEDEGVYPFINSLRAI